ncbi:MAG: 50S ribosomal protein L25 [Planctomycetota bacterium]
MHEDAPTIAAKKREKLGSRYSKRIREAGGLPAVVYGHKEDPEAVELDAHSTLKLIHKGEKVFQLAIEGGKTETVLLKDLQFDHLGTNIVHADFARVDLDERVNVHVPIRLVGEAVGLKKSGATLMHAITSLDLECAVTNLPEFIEVDISALDVGGTIHAKDVKLPKPTMKLLSEPNAEVAHILEHGGGGHGDEEATIEGGASPEVIGEKKEG